LPSRTTLGAVFCNPGPHAGWRTRAALARDQSYLGALRFVVGYGYQTWRALIGLLVILVADAGAGLGLGAGHTRSSPTQYVATHTRATASPGTACYAVYVEPNVWVHHHLRCRRRVRR